MNNKILYFLLLLIITSCANLNHGNFNKRKYLNLKLKSSYNPQNIEKQNDATIDLTTENISPEIEISLKNTIENNAPALDSKNGFTTTTENLNESDNQDKAIKIDSYLLKETNKIRKRINKTNLNQISKKDIDENNTPPSKILLTVAILITLLLLVVTIYIGYYLLILAFIFWLVGPPFTVIALAIIAVLVVLLLLDILAIIALFTTAIKNQNGYK